jgi:translocator protein
MDRHKDQRQQTSVPKAAAIGAAALLLPALLSMSSTPSPNHPGIWRWYKSLREPAFKPPDALFPIVWTGIEAALAVAGYRLARAQASPARTRSLTLWGWNVVTIGAWSRLFFKRHDLGASTVAAAGLVATSAAFSIQAKSVDRIAARAGLPLLGWAAFATVLTAAVWQLNYRKTAEYH